MFVFWTVFRLTNIQHISSPTLFPFRSIIYYIFDTIRKEVNCCVRKNCDKNRYTRPVCSSGRSQDHFWWNAYRLFRKQSGVIQKQRSNMELPDNGSSYRSDRTLRLSCRLLFYIIFYYYQFIVTINHCTILRYIVAKCTL